MTHSDAPDETAADAAMPPSGMPEIRFTEQSSPSMEPLPSAEPLPTAAAVTSGGTSLDSADAKYILESFAAPGLATWAWISGGVLVAGLLGAIALTFAVSISFPGIAPDASQALALALVALGASLGGGLTATTVGDGLVANGVGATLTVLPLGSLALVVAVVALVVSWKSPRGRATSPGIAAELARAVIEAAGAALLVTLLVAFAAFGGVSGRAGLEFRTQPGLVFLSVLLTVAIALFVSRTWRRQIATAHRGGVFGALREGGLYLAVQFVAFALAAIVALSITSVQAGSVTPLLVGLPLLGNLAATGAALGHFGAIASFGGAVPASTISALDIDGHGGWFVVIALLSTVIAAGVVGIRRPRASRPVWRRVWQMPLVVFLAWCALGVGLVPISVTGEALTSLAGGRLGSFGVAWWTPLVVAIGAALTSVAAEFVPGLARRLSPGILILFGGRRRATAWTRGDNSSAATSPDADGAARSPLVGDIENGSVARELPHEPMTPKAKRTLAIVGSVVSGVVLLAVASAVTVGLVNQSRDPSALVSTYLGFIADGKADEANDIVDPGLRTEERLLLTDEVLGSAEQRLEVVKVRTVDRSTEGATVEATISVDGERFEKMFFLTAGPKEFLVLDTWELEDALVVPVSVGASGLDEITVGAASVPLPENEQGYGDYRSRTLYAYPGLYTLSAQQTEYISASSVTLRVTPDADFGGGASASVTAEPSDAFQQSVLAQVQERVTQCVQVPTNMDDACPYVTQQDDLAELTLVAQTEGFEEITLGYFESSDATIAVRDSPSLFDRTPELEETDISVSGSITFEDGKPVIADVSMSVSW